MYGCNNTIRVVPNTELSRSALLMDEIKKLEAQDNEKVDENQSISKF